MITYFQIVLFLFITTNSDTVQEKCTHSNKEIKIGEKIVHFEDEGNCNICECLINGFLKCKVIDCGSFDCRKATSIEKPCCQELKCKGKIYIILELSQQKLSKLKNEKKNELIEGAYLTIRKIK